MSFHWPIELQTQRVTIRADADFTRADVEAYLKAVKASGAVTWSKLFDGRFRRTLMSREDVLTLGVLFRSYHERGPADTRLQRTRAGPALDRPSTGRLTALPSETGRQLLGLGSVVGLIRRIL